MKIISFAEKSQEIKHSQKQLEIIKTLNSATKKNNKGESTI